MKRFLPALAMISLGACFLGGWIGGGPSPIQPMPSMTMSIESFADSTVATATCGDAAWRAASAVSTCEWQNTLGAASVTTPDGFTSRLVLTGAAGATAVATFKARGKNAIGDVGPYATATRTLTVGFPPISAPVITVVVVP